MAVAIVVFALIMLISLVGFGKLASVILLVVLLGLGLAIAALRSKPGPDGRL